MKKLEEQKNDLIIKQLPFPMIKKDFDPGEKNCNYEIYLLELLNASNYFFKKSKGSKYIKPISEAKKEEDAISDGYCIDFKLFSSSSFFYAKSNTVNKIITHQNGLVSYVSPKNEDEYWYTSIIPVLRKRNLSNLIEVEKSDEDDLITIDLKRLLKILATNKNILFFFPFIFEFISEVDHDAGAYVIRQLLEKDLLSIIEYRRIKTRKETYFSVVYNEKLLVFRFFKKKLKLVDSIDVSKSKNIVIYSENIMIYL